MPPPPFDAEIAARPAGGQAASARTDSLPEAFRSVEVPRGRRFWRKLAAFAGPGYLVAVGYMDPGNWATDVAGGSRFGYALLSVVLLSNLAAVFLQWLSLRLGIASGRDLAQICRERFGRPVAIGLWLTSEVAIIACDLAEILGAAIALELLFGLPLLAGVGVTVVAAVALLGIGARDFRRVEALVIALVALVGACLAAELTLVRPDAAAIARGLVPSPSVIANPAMLYIALGIFGATVMPHNLYLHSALAQTRRYERTDRGRREAIRFSTLDCVAALTFALFVNAAILILAAAAFNRTGHTEVANLRDAYKLLSPLVGTAMAGILFGAALLASGQNSALTGTLAGQVVMEGFLGLRISPAARRLLTRGVAALPAFGAVAVMGDAGAETLLLLSQVVLSLQLGFAVVPLVIFTSDARVMGAFVNPRWAAGAGWLLGGVIVAVNGWLVVRALWG